MGHFKVTKEKIVHIGQTVARCRWVPLTKMFPIPTFAKRHFTIDLQEAMPIYYYT